MPKIGPPVEVPHGTIAYITILDDDDVVMCFEGFLSALMDDHEALKEMWELGWLITDGSDEEGVALMYRYPIPSRREVRVVRQERDTAFAKSPRISAIMIKAGLCVVDENEQAILPRKTGRGPNGSRQIPGA